MLPIVRRIWDSPTATTWWSLGARIVALGVTLPLVVTNFSEVDVTLWYLFANIMALQLVADIGMSSVFARVYAYGMGGATSIGDFVEPNESQVQDRPNWELIGDIVGTARWVYVVACCVWLVAVGALGTWASSELVVASENASAASLAWLFVVVASTVRLFGNQYSSFLLGTDHIPLWRRWESLTWVAASVVGVTALLAGGGLLALTIATQSCIVIGVWVNRVLCKRILSDAGVGARPYNTEIMTEVWPRSWRSGLGILLHTGMVHASGVWFAKVGEVSMAASFLLAYNVLRAIDQFAQAPFYTKLPMIARLRVQGDTDRQHEIAERGMRITLAVLGVSLLGAGLVIPRLFEAIGTSVSFVEPRLWALMALAIFAERFGANHLQLYTTTNRIVLHVANGVAGVIYVGTLIVLFPFLSVYALPIAHLTANLCWYDWYCAAKSYSVSGLRFWRHEVRTSVFPALLLGGYVIAVLWDWPVSGVTE